MTRPTLGDANDLRALARGYKMAYEEAIQALRCIAVETPPQDRCVTIAQSTLDDLGEEWAS